MALLHGGDITVQSRVGAGSTFSFTFTGTHAAASEVYTEEAARTQTAGGPATHAELGRTLAGGESPPATGSGSPVYLAGEPAEGGTVSPATAAAAISGSRLAAALPAAARVTVSVDSADVESGASGGTELRAVMATRPRPPPAATSAPGAAAAFAGRAATVSGGGGGTMPRDGRRGGVGPRAAPAPQHPPLRCLLVDDDRAGGMMVQRLLQHNGITTTLVASVDAALAALAAPGVRYDGLITDYNLNDHAERHGLDLIALARRGGAAGAGAAATAAPAAFTPFTGVAILISGDSDIVERLPQWRAPPLSVSAAYLRPADVPGIVAVLRGAAAPSPASAPGGRSATVA